MVRSGGEESVEGRDDGLFAQLGEGAGGRGEAELVGALNEARGSSDLGEDEQLVVLRSEEVDQLSVRIGERSLFDRPFLQLAQRQARIDRCAQGRSQQNDPPRGRRCCRSSAYF